MSNPPSTTDAPTVTNTPTLTPHHLQQATSGDANQFAHEGQSPPEKSTPDHLEHEKANTVVVHLQMPIDDVVKQVDNKGLLIDVPPQEVDPCVVQPYIPPEDVPLWPIITQCASGGMIYGFCTSIIGGLSDPLVTYKWFTEEDGNSSNKRQTMTGVLTACILMGAFVGTIAGLPFSNYFGRRASFVAIGLITIGTCLGLAFVESFAALCSVRAILGIAVGMTCVICPGYTAECTPISKRGPMGSVYQFSLVTAVLLAEIVNYVCNTGGDNTVPNWNWHMQLGLGGVFGLIMLFCCLLPESPVWLEEQRAKKACQERDAALAAANKPAYQEPVSDEPVGYIGLIHPSNIRFLALALLLAIGNQLTGVNAVIYYAPSIFESAGYEDLKLVLTIVVVGAWNAISCAIAIPIIRIFTRRQMMLTAQVIMMLGLLLMVLAFGTFYDDRADACIVAIILYLFGYELGPGPLFFVIASEAFPPGVRQAGLSLANATSWVCNILVTFTFPLLNGWSAWGTFLIFLGILFAVQIGFYFLCPDLNDSKEAERIAGQSPNPGKETGDAEMFVPATSLTSMTWPSQSATKAADDAGLADPRT